MSSALSILRFERVVSLFATVVGLLSVFFGALSVIQLRQ